MSGRKLTTAITLAVLLLVLIGMAAYGYNQLTAPLPGRPSAEEKCTGAEKEVQGFLKRKQVQVSVFNAGTRSGLADRTLAALTRRGFKKGEAGNAPSTSRVKVAQVWTTHRRDPAARLVARQFGPATTVRIVKVNLGPGVDVVVGDGFQRLGKAKRVVVAKTTSKACLRPRS